MDRLLPRSSEKLEIYLRNKGAFDFWTAYGENDLHVYVQIKEKEWKEQLIPVVTLWDNYIVHYHWLEEKVMVSTKNLLLTDDDRRKAAIVLCKYYSGKGLDTKTAIELLESIADPDLLNFAYETFPQLNCQN